MGVSRQEYWSGVPLPSPKKRAEDLNRHFSYDIDGQEAYEETLSITKHQGNANQTIIRHISHLSESLSFKRRGVTSVREDVKKREPNYHVSGNVSWFSQSGKQYGNAKKKKMKWNCI